MFGNNYDLALFFVRLALGSTFTMHGLQLVFGLFGGPGLNGFSSWLGTLGVPWILAYAGAFSELIGGLLVLLGIYTQVGAILIAGTMFTAICLVHLKHGYFAENKGFEYPLNLLLLCIAIILGGPGAYTLWDIFKR